MICQLNILEVVLSPFNYYIICNMSWGYFVVKAHSRNIISTQSFNYYIWIYSWTSSAFTAEAATARQLLRG